MITFSKNILHIRSCRVFIKWAYSCIINLFNMGIRRVFSFDMVIKFKIPLPTKTSWDQYIKIIHILKPCHKGAFYLKLTMASNLQWPDQTVVWDTIFDFSISEHYGLTRFILFMYPQSVNGHFSDFFALKSGDYSMVSAFIDFLSLIKNLC